MPDDYFVPVTSHDCKVDGHFPFCQALVAQDDRGGEAGRLPRAAAHSADLQIGGDDVLVLRVHQVAVLGACRGDQ